MPELGPFEPFLFKPAGALAVLSLLPVLVIFSIGLLSASCFTNGRSVLRIVSVEIVGSTALQFLETGKMSASYDTTYAEEEKRDKAG